MPRQALDDDLHKLKGTTSVAADAGTPALPGGRPKFPKGISKEAKVVFRAAGEADGSPAGNHTG